jgi:NTP pyrophosphatase (non-canonical NTP hydrolase)
VKTLAEMTTEIRENNIEKGWRSAAGGPGDNTFGDYVALLHSEISEALEAYRDHQLDDATGVPICIVHTCENLHHSNPRPGDADFGIGTPCPASHMHSSKPEGVGSELADVLIRLLDMSDVFNSPIRQPSFDMDRKLADVSPLDTPQWAKTFGDRMSWLHFRASELVLGEDERRRPWKLSHLLRALVAVTDHYGIDLASEYERKIAYNKTRPYRHGGRQL